MYSAQSTGRAGSYFPHTFRGGTAKRFGTVTEVIKSRTDEWKPRRKDIFRKPPPGRFDRTQFPKTFHVSQPIAHPTVASYMDEQNRFKTTSLSLGIFAAPDPEIPHHFDRLRAASIREFTTNRLRNRLADMEERKLLSEEAGREFEEKRIARKALNLLNYERKIRATQ